MYATKYILSSSNELNEFIEVYLDFMGYSGPSIPITSAVDGLVLRCVTADQDRLSPILGMECMVNIFVDKNSSLSIYDLTASQDSQIRVTVYKDRNYTTNIFQGFVVVEDSVQPYLDPPFNISFRALDGLGLLKGVDFADTTGAIFAGAHTPLYWICQLLYKTDQILNIRSYFNIINSTFTSSTPIESFTISVDTFQTGVLQTSTDPTIDLIANEFDDCYTVLEMIVRCLRCRLFQQDGVWNLVSIWEYQNPNGYSYSEYTINAPVAGIVGYTRIATANNLKYDVQVGYDQVLHPVKEDATISLKLATKSIKLNYTYDQSLNKICNQGFIYGDADPTHDGTISSTIEDSTIIPVITFSYKAYQPFCWTIATGTFLGGDLSAVFPESAQTADVYIRNVLDDVGASENRYLVISSNTTVSNHARSSTFLVDVNDSLEISVDFRTYSNLEPITLQPLYILLDGDDGSKWGLGGSSPGFIKWWLLDSLYRFNGETPPYNNVSFGPGTSTTDWTTFTAYRDENNAILKVPVSGKCFIVLGGLQGNQGTECWFKNLSVTIHSYLQGSYTQLSGDFNYSASNQNIKQTEVDDVQISDSPKRYFKGALLQADGDSLMAPTWIRKGFPANVMRFTQLMENIMYNALYRQFNLIQGTIRGLTYTDASYNVKEAGFLNSYFFPDHPVPTKKFMLTSFENDYGTGQGTRIYAEILNDQNDNGQVLPDQFIFQYLFNNT